MTQIPYITREQAGVIADVCFFDAEKIFTLLNDEIFVLNTGPRIQCKRADGSCALLTVSELQKLYDSTCGECLWRRTCDGLELAPAGWQFSPDISQHSGGYTFTY